MIDKQNIADAIAVKIKELKLQREELKGSTAAVQLDQSRVGRLSRMDALQSQAMHQETLRRVERQIQQLIVADNRLMIEDFGYCDECGELIASARLMMNPAVRLCIECAEKAERP